MSTENSRVPALGAPHGREVTEFDASVDVLGLPAFAGSVGSALRAPGSLVLPDSLAGRFQAPVTTRLRRVA
ncbi:hypothetical protein [Salinispora pacifica]|uniref:hypothetical protein n=1 Tax=Salinispora pacifica TaxID=351187 RepID=UPI00037A0D42|nr:hypothetical protein [Salinispora pacifica]